MLDEPCQIMQTWEVDWHDTTYVQTIFTSPETQPRQDIVGDLIQIINIVRIHHPEINPEEVESVTLVNQLHIPVTYT